MAMLHVNTLTCAYMGLCKAHQKGLYKPASCLLMNDSPQIIVWLDTLIS